MLCTINFVTEFNITMQLPKLFNHKLNMFASFDYHPTVSLLVALLSNSCCLVSHFHDLLIHQFIVYHMYQIVYILSTLTGLRITICSVGTNFSKHLFNKRLLSGKSTTRRKIRKFLVHKKL